MADLQLQSIAIDRLKYIIPTRLIAKSQWTKLDSLIYIFILFQEAQL